MDYNSNQVEEIASFQELLMGIRNEERRRLVSGFLQNLVHRMSKDREKIEDFVTAQQGGITDDNVLALMSDIFGTTEDSCEHGGSQKQPAIGSSHAYLPLGPLPPGRTLGNSNLISKCLSFFLTLVSWPLQTLRKSICRSVQGPKLEESRVEIVEKPNPLLLSPVLGVLFKKLPLKELKVCRLVCKTWRVESLSSWWTNATLKFEEYSWHAIVIRRPQNSTIQATTLAEYLDFCESECSTTPFKNLHFRKCDFPNPNLTRFFELLGEHITSLTLDYCSFDERDFVRAIMYQRFPNLQFLKMEECKFPTTAESECEYGEFYEGPAGRDLTYKKPALGVHGLKTLHLVDCLPDSMLELLSHFHMLDDVKFICEGYSDHGLLEILDAVKIVREQHPNKLPLGKFKAHLNFNFDTELVEELAELNLLQELNLPLGSLSISTQSARREPVLNLEQCGEIFRDILRKHSSTLSEFTVRKDMQGMLKEFPFGLQLNNLKRVDVRWSSFFSNLNWLVNTPNLEDLTIDWGGGDFDPSNNVISNTSELQLENWSLPSLKSLFIGFPISAGNLKKLIRWMPSVEALEMELDDENFAIVCANWKQLKELTSRGDQLTDKGVTGIWMETGLPEEETRIPANILQLKSLESFSARCPNLNFTQKSVYEGLVRLPSLVRVDLSRHSQIDAEAFAALKEKGVRVYVDYKLI